MGDTGTAGRRSAATGADLDRALPPFPGEHPPTHAAKQWLEYLVDQETKLHLQAVATGQLPLRVQHLRNWAQQFTAVPRWRGMRLVAHAH